MRSRLAAPMVMILAVVAGGCAGTRPMVTIDLATLPLDRVVNGAVHEGSGESIPCRVFSKGQPVVLSVDRWWGDGDTPPQGRTYLAVVRYRDTVDQPVRFLSYAGLARYDGASEMHRFGGYGDGQWKTARVPLPWDMLLSLPSAEGRVRLGIDSPGGDLPVASIEIVDADADAERRYNAQTRDWIRRVQAHLRAPDREAEHPVIPSDMVDQAIVPYVRSYMAVILPPSAPQAGQAGAVIRVQIAQNEYEPATFAVYAAKQNLTNVTFEVGALTGANGTLPAAIDQGTVEYCLTASGRSSTVALAAQRIWPAHPVDIPAERSHWFWITLKTEPATCRPGRYTGTVTVNADQGRATLPLEVEVLPITLLTMDQAGLLLGGCTSGLVPAHEMDVLREHNFNMINIWYPGVAPGLTIRDGKMSLDFELMDHWMAQARKHGLGPMVWFLGGSPYRYPQTMSIEREIYIALHEGEGTHKELYAQFTKLAATEANRGKTLPEVEPYYRQWVAEVWQHAKQHDWPELIMTPFDEPASWAQGPNYPLPEGAGPHIIGPGPWIKSHFKYACKLMRDAAPGMRIYASIHHNHVPRADGTLPRTRHGIMREGEVFIEDSDCFCTNAISEDPKLGDKVRAAGKAFWQYSGTGSAGLPDRARFTFGFFFNAFDSRGSLVWAYDWGTGFDTSSGNNWMFAWRTPLDVITSPYYEGMREAWDDRRYVETLKSLANQHQVDISAFLAKLAADGAALRGPGGRDTVYDFWAQPKDMAVIDELRQRVAAKILELPPSAR